MPEAQAFQLKKAFEDSNAYILARVRNLANSLITQASLSEISLKVYDSADTGDTPTEIASRSIVIADTVFDTLQTDSGWDTAVDTTGFNFKVEVLPADVPGGNKVYQFEFKLTSSVATGSKISHVVVKVPTESLFRS